MSAQPTHTVNAAALTHYGTPLAFWVIGSGGTVWTNWGSIELVNYDNTTVPVIIQFYDPGLRAYVAPGLPRRPIVVNYNIHG